MCVGQVEACPAGGATAGSGTGRSGAARGSISAASTLMVTSPAALGGAAVPDRREQDGRVHRAREAERGEAATEGVEK